MGKLNYTHRKIEGLKLGQVVAKDLSKRIPPSAGSKAALRDPVVELDISGKALTPEGFFEIAPTLVKSIDYEGEHGKVVRLEELSLSDSKLDASCLRLLGQIVASASDHLRDLDLSRNHIKITTDTEAAAWELFLSSFSNCRGLRKIDLSGNHLGPRAFEILTRVYSRETLLDAALLSESIVRRRDAERLGLLTRKLSLASSTDGHANIIPPQPRTVSGDEVFGHESTYDEGSEVQRQQGNPETRGLRSVPYVILSDTSMTVTCALHLSYIVATHNLPDALLARLPARLPMMKAGSSAQQLLAYDQDSGCRGVIYAPNPHLGPAGMKVLDLAEAMRDSFLDEASQGDNSDKVFREHKAGQNIRRASDARGNPRASDRRRSNSTPSGVDHGGYDSMDSIRAEMDRARSRIQGATIQEAGTHSNDLWRVALKVLTLGRSISSNPNSEKLPTAAKNSEGGESAILPDLISRTSRPSPLAAKNPNQSITPNLGQWRLENSRLVPLSMVETPPKKLLSPPISPLSPKATGIPYRSQLPCKFPEDIWRRIIVTAAGADGIMSDTQQLSVLRWAWDRSTLSRESESLGLKESAQIWKVLEATGCLAYEMNV